MALVSAGHSIHRSWRDGAGRRLRMGFGRQLKLNVAVVSGVRTPFGSVRPCGRQSESSRCASRCWGEGRESMRHRIDADQSS